MLIDQRKYHILELRFRNSCPSDSQETGMREAEYLIENNLFISYISFGVFDIEFVKIFEEFLDDGYVVGVHDNVHHDNDYFLV
jgi:hypothetical protein